MLCIRKVKINLIIICKLVYSFATFLEKKCFYNKNQEGKRVTITNCECDNDCFEKSYRKEDLFYKHQCQAFYQIIFNISLSLKKEPCQNME